MVDPHPYPGAGDATGAESGRREPTTPRMPRWVKVFGVVVAVLVLVVVAVMVIGGGEHGGGHGPGRHASVEADLG